MGIRRHALLLTAVLLAAPAVAPRAQEPASWWDEGWTERVAFLFEDTRSEAGAEAFVARFRTDGLTSSTVASFRAVDDRGATLPLQVLDWSPEGEALCAFGLRTGRVWPEDGARVHLYLRNPDAGLEAFNYPWLDPHVLIGDQVSPLWRRHGAWDWRADERFGAAHRGRSAQDRRETHSVSGLENIALHAAGFRLVQMVRIDPSDPPEAIGVDLVSNRGARSLYWTNAPEPPENVIAGTQALWAGPLPEPGRWTLLEAGAEDLGLNSDAALSAIGFSTHGGTLDWGPTALNAMACEGKALARERVIPRPASASFRERVPSTRIEPLALLPAEPSPYTAPADLHLDLVRAPIFLEPDDRLRLTSAVRLGRDFLRETAPCRLATVGERKDGSTTTLAVQEVRFIGGGDWQGAVELSAEEWTPCRALRLDLSCRGEPVAERTVRLGRLDGVGAGEVRAEGDLLKTGEDFLILCVDPDAPAPIPSPALTAPVETLLLTTDRYAASDSPAGRASADAAPHTQRTAAQWAAEAVRLASGDKPCAVRIEVRPDLRDLGLRNIAEAGRFLRGTACVLRSNPLVEAHMDLSALSESAHREMSRLLLAESLVARRILDPEVPEGRAGVPVSGGPYPGLYSPDAQP